METKRCPWATTDLYMEYHDHEWGKPLHDDQKLFEFLILEGMQAGLSWLTILNKRENMRVAFDGFDPNKMAQYDDEKRETLLQNLGIIRNKLKIKAITTNANAFLAVQEEFGTFDAYIWRFVGGQPILNEWREIEDVPAKTELSDAMSKDLIKRGFKFVGSTICYAYMQAVGMVNDHLVSCEQYGKTAPKMTHYIALLRGVNVGGKNKVSMSVLKEAFENKGLKEVVTYINSGNILFLSELDPQEVKALCQDTIYETFGLEVPVSILKDMELIEILENAPEWWNKDPDSKHNMIFVMPPATPKEIFALVGQEKPEYEKVAQYGNGIFWSAPLKTFSKTRWSKVSGNKEAYQAITIRNANTTLKLAKFVKGK